ncbi:hypothetical protein BG011_007597 [Mortierella polycephala]|uniref:HTH CENPB-type domain-containing protein n=1 Tax=Mortierella polycephala TaxID=41804 RepID=A0A9P6PSZ9_9FUNG|nr:hypothetical protein BG011_007597 [Mortierella polycephala]
MKRPVRLVTKTKTTSPSETSPTRETTNKKQRRSISLPLKAEFIKDLQAQRELDPQLPATSVARWDKYNFNTSETTRILQNSEDILLKVQEAGPSNSMKISRLYSRKMEVVKKILYLAFKEEIDANTSPLMEPGMRPAPIEFSDGWLANFKKNNNIHMHTAHGEEGDVDMIAHDPRFKEIAKQLSRYDPTDFCKVSVR